jgi:hypothetical protein
LPLTSLSESDNLAGCSRVAHRLTSRILSLQAELADAELFQQAYYNLLEEVGTLVDRNALAEKEADHLSKLNAEILGHHNPGQRILYVDKIRRELANTKQVRDQQHRMPHLEVGLIILWYPAAAAVHTGSAGDHRRQSATAGRTQHVQVRLRPVQQ